MATIVSSNKRSLDECLGNAAPAACSPHKISFLDLTEVTGPVKRRTSFLDTSGPMKRLRQVHDRNVSQASTPVLPIRDSAFAGVATDTLDTLEVPSGKKAKLCRLCQNNAAERLFSSEEVRAIVAKALKKNEEELKFEYDRILQDKLAEQFNNFSKYYEDYVSKMSKHSDFSYMS